MALEQSQLVKGSDRKKPVFVVCGKCGNTAKRLHFQNKYTKYNPVDMAFCTGCNVFTNLSTNEIITKNTKGELIKCA